MAQNQSETVVRKIISAKHKDLNEVEIKYLYSLNLVARNLLLLAQNCSAKGERAGNYYIIYRLFYCENNDLLVTIKHEDRLRLICSGA